MSVSVLYIIIFIPGEHRPALSGHTEASGLEKYLPSNDGTLSQTKWKNVYS